jgi:predicted metal-dependent enzyme (double-stranded beta helix superfamily)
MAAELAAATVAWELVIGAAPSERRWEHVLLTDQYDVWSIFWPPGAVLGLHDHGGSAGALCVVSGELSETVLTRTGPRARQLRVAQAVAFGSSHVHSVENRGGAGATSVHLYSPPLRSRPTAG